MNTTIRRVDKHCVRSAGIVIGAAIAALVVSPGITAPAQAAEERPVEEMVVTGSFIRGTPEDAPSPVLVLSRDELVGSGVSDIGEAVRNLSITSGSDTAPTDGTRFNGATGGGLANVNLRGLGPTSTLVLLDGKRLPYAGQKLADGDRFVDINSIPITMVERVEVLKDGGSALYGSDAIAGVVNFITRSEFEGFELRYNYQQTTSGSQDDQTLGAIWGISTEDGRGHLVIGGEYFDRGQLESSERKQLLRDQFAKQDASIVNSSTAFVPNGTRNFAGDPACEQLGYFRDTFNNTAPTACFRSGVETGILIPDQRRRSIMTVGSFAFAEAFEVYTQLSFVRTESGANQPVYVGPIEPKFFLPGLVGNFNATPIGRAANDPSQAFNGGPLTLDPAQGFTDLVDYTLRVPGMGPQREGEVFSNEQETTRYQVGARGEFEIGTRDWRYDVSVTHGESTFSNRLLGIDKNRLELATYGLGGPSCTPNGTVSGPAAAFARNFLAGADGVFDRGAFGTPGNQGALETTMLSLMGDVQNFAFINPDNLVLAMTSSNIGQGGCQFFNPYLTRFTNPALANSDELIRWLEVDMKDFQESETFETSYDAVVSGEVFELWGRTVAIALGAQYREEGRETHVHPQLVGSVNSFGQLVGGESVAGLSENRNFDADRDAYSFFLEVQVPLGEDVDMQFAARYEDYGDLGDTFDPKFALRWQALESLALRGSISSSFRAPAIAQIEEGTGFSLEFGVRDVLGAAGAQAATNGAQCVRTGRCAIPDRSTAPSVIIVKQGLQSPNLSPESAITYNFGAIFAPVDGPLEGLSVGIDYYVIQFEDKIIDVPTQAFLTQELELFQAALAANNFVIVAPGASFGTACNPQLAQFAVGGAQAEQCQVNPNAYTVSPENSTFGGSIMRRQDLTRSLQIIAGNAINTGKVETDGIDLTLGYRVDFGDYGMVVMGSEFSWVNKFEVKDFPIGQPDFDAAGFTNRDPERRLSRSMPDFKGALSLNWLKGPHSVNTSVRYVGAYEDNAVASLRLQRELGPYHTVDVRYSYEYDWNDTTLLMSVGVIDLFDADLPNVKDNLGTDFTQFDSRGRRVYAGLTYKM